MLGFASLNPTYKTARANYREGKSVSKVVIQFLGSGDAFGSGGRGQTCIHVVAGDYQFLIDCGASALASMKRWGVSPASIDSILITHLHGDHFGGIPFFILEAQLVSKRTRPLVIAGPPGLEDRIHKAMEVSFPGSSRTRQKFSITYIELAERMVKPIGPLMVNAYPMVHASGAPAYALRVAVAGRLIVYSGDTEWTDTLAQAAWDADLFICEAYFFDKKVKNHLDYATLAAHRPEIACQRLILTHMSDDMLARLPGLDVEAAEDGTRIVL